MKCRIEIHSEAGQLFAGWALDIARGIARHFGLRVRVWYQGPPCPVLIFEIRPQKDMKGGVAGQEQPIRSAKRRKDEPNESDS